MLVDTRSIPQSGLEARGDIAAGCLDIVDPTIKWRSPVSCDLRLQVAGGLLLVRGTLGCRVDYTCSRCLKKYPAELKVDEFRAEIEFAPPFAIIDLTANIRQDIILALQYKPICSVDCRGLCLRCGRDLNLGSCDCAPPDDGSPFSRLDSFEIE